MDKANLKREDLCQALRVEANTLKNYIYNPFMIKLDHLIILAGLFGVPVEELVYILVRYKKQITKEGSSYIGSLIDKHK